MNKLISLLFVTIIFANAENSEKDESKHIDQVNDGAVEAWLRSHSFHGFDKWEMEEEIEFDPATNDQIIESRPKRAIRVPRQIQDFPVSARKHLQRLQQRGNFHFQGYDEHDNPRGYYQDTQRRYYTPQYPALLAYAPPAPAPIPPVHVGGLCGDGNTKDCTTYGASYKEKNLFIITCVDGGKKATCPTPDAKNGSILACQGTNSKGFYCKRCNPWGESCSKDEDCCLGFNDDMKGWPLPLKKDGFCHKPFYKDKETGLMLQPAKGKCVPCLDDRDPCIGTKLPFCGKLKYLTSTAKCRDKDTGGKGGMDRKGHNLNLGWLFPPASPDPCTPEADLAKIGNESFPMDGSSNCWMQHYAEKDKAKDFNFIIKTPYPKSYFCKCPDNKLTGYSCQNNAKAIAKIRALGAVARTTDNGRRCQRCGLQGHACGPPPPGAPSKKPLPPRIPCCDFHTCKNGKCHSPECTMIGSMTNYKGKKTKCCGGAKFFRGLKEGRCTDNLCHTQIGGKCSGHEDCCGRLVCQKESKLSLVGTCQKCMKDGVKDPTRKCVGIYDCCSSYPTWRNLYYTDYSECKDLKEKRPSISICAACTKVNATCDDYSHCCKDYTCNAKRKTCSDPPDHVEQHPPPEEGEKDWEEVEKDDEEKGHKFFRHDENENDEELDGRYDDETENFYDNDEEEE